MIKNRRVKTRCGNFLNEQVRFSKKHLCAEVGTLQNASPKDLSGANNIMKFRAARLMYISEVSTLFSVKR